MNDETKHYCASGPGVISTGIMVGNLKSLLAVFWDQKPVNFYLFGGFLVVKMRHPLPLLTFSKISFCYQRLASSSKWLFLGCQKETKAEKPIHESQIGIASQRNKASFFPTGFLVFWSAVSATRDHITKKEPVSASSPGRYLERACFPNCVMDFVYLIFSCGIV